MTATIDSLEPVLMSRDVAASISFYERLGFVVTFRDDPVVLRYAGLQRDGATFHLQWQAEEQWSGGHDRPTYRFRVDDVEALFQEFREAGVIQDRGPTSGPWSAPGNTPWGTREFHVHDPDGNGLQFYRPL